MKTKRSSNSKRAQQLPDDPQERRRVLDELDAAKPPAVKAREWARDARFNRKMALEYIDEGPRDPLSDERVDAAITALYFLTCEIKDAISGRGIIGRDLAQHLRRDVHSAATLLLRIATKYPATEDVICTRPMAPPTGEQP